jgi:hypothetical protein
LKISRLFGGNESCAVVLIGQRAAALTLVNTNAIEPVWWSDLRHQHKLYRSKYLADCTVPIICALMGSEFG